MAGLRRAPRCSLLLRWPLPAWLALRPWSPPRRHPLQLVAPLRRASTRSVGRVQWEDSWREGTRAPAGIPGLAAARTSPLLLLPRMEGNPLHRLPRGTPYLRICSQEGGSRSLCL
jgi:hypothetical protein